MKKILLSLSLLFSVNSESATERIQAMRFDRGAVMKIYLAPGLGSLILFPCGLSEVFIGRSDDLLAQISTTDKKNLFLNLKLNASLPTNIIAKCDEERNVFVLDIIPSRNRHQDLIDIRSVFGQAKRSDIVEFKKSSASKTSVVIEKPVLLESGERK